MAERTKHLFEFRASQIARAAAAEAEYHRERLGHWRERELAALEKVRGSGAVDVQEQEVTGGSRYHLWAKCDENALAELHLAAEKRQSHLKMIERFEQAAGVYGTQGDRVYNLDPEDVEFYRLGNQARED